MSIAERLSELPEEMQKDVLWNIHQRHPDDVGDIANELGVDMNEVVGDSTTKNNQSNH